MPQCSHCNCQVAYDATFCPNCGKRGPADIDNSVVQAIILGALFVLALIPLAIALLVFLGLWVFLLPGIIVNVLFDRLPESSDSLSAAVTDVFSWIVSVITWFLVLVSLVAALGRRRGIALAKASPLLENLEDLELEKDADKLIAEIRQRVKQRDLDGLLPKVTRAVELRGDRADLQRLQEQLQEREERLASQRDQARRPLEQPRAREISRPGTPSESASSLQETVLPVLAIAFAVVLVTCLVLAMTKSTNRQHAEVDSGQHVSSRPLATGTHEGPTPNEMDSQRDVPPLAVAPFDPVQAKEHQEAWAEYLGQPVEVTNSIGMTLTLIPPGEFLMGSPDSDRAPGEEKPQHKVRITQAFFLGIYEVTQAQWELVMGSNPSHFRGDDYPVENVSWNDCQQFIRRLKALPSERGVVYRLPTEAEWEYACRAGSTTVYNFGDSAASLGDYAWYSANSNRSTHPVGQKRPNAWGLYDMHGNLWEWCSDW